MSPTDSEDDPSFVALSARLRHRIDDAFDSIASQLRQSRVEVSAGGFIAEESEPGPSQLAEYEAGGFIVEDFSSNSVGAQSHIPLSEIPRALKLLDLFPDDDLMGVFKNAATGWGAQNAYNDGVSRKDWRAVCAALLEGEHVDGSDEENLVEDEDVEIGADSGPDSDEYQIEELSDEDSSDEYEEPGPTAARTKPEKAQNVPRRTPTKSSAGRQLTESQKAQCRQDFSRFFPQVPDDELDHQRIMVKDITRVADLLKENLKTEEVRAPHVTLTFY